MTGQSGQLVVALGVEGSCQVAITAGNIGHGIDRVLQWLGDAAHDQHNEQGHQGSNHQANQQGFQGLGVKLGLHIIDINP